MNGQAADPDSVHRMFVPLPRALWILSLGGDAVYHLGLGGLVWKEVALYAMAGGVGAALASAITGYRAWLGRGDPATPGPGQQVMWLHGVLLLSYCVNVWIRLTAHPDAALPVWLSIGGLLLLRLSADQAGEGRSSDRIDQAPRTMNKSHRAA
jgi:uncharacterized membrane protein